MDSLTRWSQLLKEVGISGILDIAVVTLVIYTFLERGGKTFIVGHLAVGINMEDFLLAPAFALLVKENEAGPTR